MRRLAALTTAAVPAAVLALSGLAGSDGAAVAARSPETRYAQQAFTATNAQRTQRGLRELRAGDCLHTFARRQARLMAQREQVFHQGLGPVMRECGLSAAGENVAYGYPSGRSVVVDGWMSSDGHRANLLSPSYRLMAIGARKGHDGRWYVAQVFGRRS